MSTFTTTVPATSTFSTPSVNGACPNVDVFLYDSANCDEGYWCGCSDPTGQNCLPSNDVGQTQWGGQYTDVATGIVYTGWAQTYSDPTYFQCPDSLYCPGSNGPAGYCPSLCDAGYYCPTPTQKIECDEGAFCLVGSTEPTECTAMNVCKGTGNDIYRPVLGNIVILIVVVLSFGGICIAYRRLNSKAKSNNKKDVAVDNNTSNDEEGQFENNYRTNETRKPSVITTPEPAQKIDVSFSELQLTLPNGKCIMQGVSGALRSGQFTAIMGPSGAGKSTFLSLLSGKVEPTGGCLTVNGEKTSLTRFKKLVGFVPQEDIMLRELTVEENIRHSALMRLPADWTKERKLQRVAQVMESLELTQIKDSIIGDDIRRGISGGQRKRVNVAMELVADPSLLALDEPTSGLDSTTSHSLTETLHSLAKTGVNVAAVLHQPKNEIFEVHISGIRWRWVILFSSITIINSLYMYFVPFQMFDNVLLLGVGGRTVYHGPAKDMTDYFTRIGFPLPERTNPADYYMDVVAGLIPCEISPKFTKDDLFEMWETAPENPKSEPQVSETTTESSAPVRSKCMSLFACKKNKDNDDTRKTPGVVSQTSILFRRAVLQRVRIPQNTMYPIVLSAFASIIIGLTAHTYGLADGTGENTKPLYYGIPTAAVDPSNAASQFLENWPIPSTDQTVQVWQNTAMIVMLVCILSVNTFGQEEAVLKRDTSSGTRVFSYWLAKTMETFLWLPIFAAIFAGLSFVFQPLTISLFDFWVVTWMAFVGFYGVGHSISVVVGPANRGIVMLVLSLVLVLIFTGLLFPYGTNQNPLFKVFFTFWTAQGYSAESYAAYESFDVELLNEKVAGYDLSYSFGANVAYAFVSGFAWHVLALILLWRKTA